MEHARRSQLVAAALELFATNGYDATSVDDIAAYAGVSRSSFFRYFATKEGVVFPGHDELIPLVESHLRHATEISWRSVLRQAARMVLDHYVSEGEAARARYRLAGSVPALRQHELTTVHRYQRLFARYARQWILPSDGVDLRSELLAASVTSANNHVIRLWLRELTTSVDQDFDDAMDLAFQVVTEHRAPNRRVLVVEAEATDLESVLAAVRESWLTNGETS